MIWDERYSEPDYIYGKEPNEFLKQHAEKIPKGEVLSLAEGEGRNAVYLAGLGYQVTAVDASKVGLEKAEKLAEEKGVSIHTVLADLADYQPETGKYNGVVSIFCHVPPQARKILYQQLGNIIKPGGVLILEAYTPDQVGRGTGGPPDTALTVSLEEMNNYLDDFDVLLAEELERHVIEGKYHTGLGAVLQVIARRKS